MNIEKFKKEYIFNSFSRKSLDAGKGHLGRYFSRRYTSKRFLTIDYSDLNVLQV